MKNREFKAFSMAEVLVALSLIGILCVTMLSLNTTADNDYKIAATKLAQIDSALQSWGKAVTKSNETGLGATATITSNETLVNSIKNYFENNNEDVKENVVIQSTKGAYQNGNEITLNPNLPAGLYVLRIGSQSQRIVRY